MMDWRIGDREVTANSLWQVLGDLEDGALSPEEQEDLWALLSASQEARQIYLRYSEFSALLQIKAATQAEEGSLPVLQRVGEQRRTLGISVVAAAALLLVLGVVAALVKLQVPETRALAFEATAGSQWTVVGTRDEGASSSPTLDEGSVVSLASGTLRFNFDSGARIVLQGPALVRFPKLEEPVIEEGWLWVDTGQSGTRFQIDAPDFAFRNIGTRFGLRVQRGGETELHLLSGVVEAREKPEEVWKVFKASEKGWKLVAEEPIERLARAADPFPVVDKMLKSPMSYATAIMGQTPVGYWCFAEESGSESENLIVSGKTGLLSSGVEPNHPGPRPSDGFAGFKQENSGVLLSGLGTESVVRNLDSASGVSQKEGAVAFWFRREAGIGSREVLWFAGAPGADGLGPESETEVFLSEKGQVQFFLGSGRDDLLLSSNEAVDDGAWHHVVATWRTGHVELFLDGRFCAGQEREERSSWPRFGGDNVRLGKTGSAYQPGVRDLGSFRGMVDELALWGRSLTPSEVRIQYEAAVGSE